MEIFFFLIFSGISICLKQLNYDKIIGTNKKYKTIKVNKIKKDGFKNVEEFPPNWYSKPYCEVGTDAVSAVTVMKPSSKAASSLPLRILKYPLSPHPVPQLLAAIQ